MNKAMKTANEILNRISHSKYFRLHNDGMKPDIVYGNHEFRFTDSGKVITKFITLAEKEMNISWYDSEDNGDNIEYHIPILKPRKKYTFSYDGGYFYRIYVNGIYRFFGEE